MLVHAHALLAPHLSLYFALSLLSRWNKQGPDIVWERELFGEVKSQYGPSYV